MFGDKCRRCAHGSMMTALLVLLMAGGAGAFTVDGSGGADYTGIQDAINAASAGDTIEVYSGLYFENVVVDKQLELRGQDNGGGMPVVNALGSGNAITITASGVILDGFDAKNGVSYSGIRVTSKNNVIINNNASGNNYGIYLSSSSNNTLRGNNANLNKDFGIYLSSASNNTLSGNKVSNNRYGIYLSSSSNNNTLSGNNASNNGCYGISLSYSSNNNSSSVAQIICLPDGSGISLSYSSNNTLNGNNASNNNHGILLSSSDNNTLSSNNASNNYYGISLYSSSNNNTLSGNTINSNKHGIYLSYSFKNTLSRNTVNSNNEYGIYLDSSIKNSIYNNLFNNSNNYYTPETTNNWNMSKTAGTNIIGGSCLGGNFWAKPDGTGFSQTCTDADSDGICDSSYILDEYNIDYLPLAYKPETKGDLNRNGRRDTGDATLMLRSIVELSIPSEYLPVLPAGDMNCNNRIDTGDATLVLRDIVNLPIPRCWE